MRHTAIRTLAVSALILTAGAGRSGAATAPDAGGAADSIRIQRVVADLDSAWNSGDADRWAAHYTEDAEFINILGMLMSGPEAIRARLHEIMTGVFRGSRHEGILRRVRFLGPDVAIADVIDVVTGFTALPPGSRPTEPGVLRTRMRHVLRREGNAWRIVATQNTAIAPRP